MSDELKKILNEPVLSDVVDRYFSTKDMPQESTAINRYRLFSERLDAKRFVLPVAGVQGSGKSSLLNSIAFKAPVLPIDADETTCVPVEIRWAANPGGKAIVLYQDGRQDNIPATEKHLAAFVHNGNNVGNVKGVDRVILESDSQILESGIVLVDLPGTGSLTSTNMETTRRYLDESVGAIFMLRTIPPLTQSESVFVSLQWGRLPSAFFVQNRWNDETMEEANSGRDHNVVVLKDIATRNHIANEGNPTVYVVNAYKAVEGSFKSSDEIIIASGLTEFTHALREFGKNWPDMVKSGIRLAVLNDLYAAKSAIDSDLALQTADKGKILEELKIEQERFDEYIGKVKKKQIAWAKIIEDEINMQSTSLSEWAKKAKAELRNEMRTKMRAGIVDGPRLERSLFDEEQRHYDDIIVSIEEALLSLQDQLRELFKDIVDWQLRKNPRFETVSTEEKTKYENIIPRALGSGLGIAGGYYGYVYGYAAGAWAGAKIGGMIGSYAGPIGIGVGIVAGAIGGLIAGWLGNKVGNKARELATEKRASDVQPMVFAAIDKFTEQTEKDLISHMMKLQADMKTAIQAWEVAQVSAFDTERLRREDALHTGKETKEVKIAACQSDLAIVVSYIKRIDSGGLDG